MIARRRFRQMGKLGFLALLMTVTGVVLAGGRLRAALFDPADNEESYQGWTAERKAALLLDLVDSTRYPLSRLPEIPELSFSQTAKLFSQSFLYTTFGRESDFLPDGRQKLLHPMGSVGGFEFVPTGGLSPVNRGLSPSSAGYTGLFEGAQGVMRLSLAGNEDSLSSYTPGIALKFLVDGLPSQNILVMNRLEGQGEDRNFFSLPFSNVIPAPEATNFKLLEIAFKRVLDPANELPLGHLASVTKYGKEVQNPQAPWQIILVPTPEAQRVGALSPKDDHRFQLSRLKPGTVLYTVQARRLRGGELERIGSLRLTTPLVPSKFGDERLFFQHAW